MKDEYWDRALLTALPVLGIGISLLSVGLTVMERRELARRVAGRVRYVDGEYLVNVRYFNQWVPIREFIRPLDPLVQAVYQLVGPDYWALFDYVTRSIAYRRDFGEYWKYPAETLSGGTTGDCEDTSILLVSLLQNGPFNSYVVVGTYQGYGHAWVDLNGIILETTYTYARLTTDPENYKTYMYFNNVEVVEVSPGALQDIYSVPRAEAKKLRLMAGG